METNITCLHCYKENVASSHRCIFELLDNISNEIAEIKEWRCENSGLNWKDHYEYLKSEVIKY